MSTVSAALDRYNRIRDFGKTAEPAGRRRARAAKAAPLRFVIQKHWASRLHYDFRLEFDGVLLSWAVPKGPSFDPSDKRMAIHVEDHPVDYAAFEGEIPADQYGGGSVIVWDHGTWVPVGDARTAMQAGKLVFSLHGAKLAGLWELVRIAKPGEKADNWILFKKRDEWARPRSEFDVVTALPDSVISQPDPSTLRSDDSLSNSRSVDDAPRRPLPARLAPQLATLSSTVPVGDGWIIETKFDGYRVMAKFVDAKASLFTRNGHDWTSKLKGVAAEIETLDISEGWIDGEIVVLRDGLPDFHALQNAMSGAENASIVFFAFDIPFWEGRDLRTVPLAARRAHLETLVAGCSQQVRFSEAFDAPSASVFQAACKLGLEGLMFKRADSTYTSGRSKSWVKAKCKLRQEFVVGGFSDRDGAPQEVGNLLLGVHDERGTLTFVGAVGTGWDGRTAAQLHKSLQKLSSNASPFDAPVDRSGRWAKSLSAPVRWVTPKVVVEVEFGEWTPDGQIRHASFKGVRADKPATEIRREAAVASVFAQGTTAVKVTHPDRIIDPSTGLTKVDVVRYYEAIAPAMLPHLAGRPVSLVRAPEGISGPMFFQKHAESALPQITEHDPRLWPGHTSVLTIESADALVAAAQLNVVEFHTWNSTVARIDSPDRILFDLDPGEGVPWEHVQDAALLVRTLLEALGLTAWLKTSGGKGLHVVVPLAPRRGYEAVKAFSESVARHIAATIPQRFVARQGPLNRKGKIFVDYLRNGFSQTTAAAFSARARPGLGVSMPVSWEKLLSLKSGAQWTIRDAREYMSFQTSDPWEDYWSTRQTLTEAIKRLG